MNVRALPFCVLLATLACACAPVTDRFDTLFDEGRGPASDGTYKVTRFEAAAQGSHVGVQTQSGNLRKISIGGSYHREHSVPQVGDGYKTKLGLHGDPTRDH